MRHHEAVPAHWWWDHHGALWWSIRHVFLHWSVQFSWHGHLYNFTARWPRQAWIDDRRRSRFCRGIYKHRHGELHARSDCPVQVMSLITHVRKPSMKHLKLFGQSG